MKYKVVGPVNHVIVEAQMSGNCELFRRFIKVRLIESPISNKNEKTDS
jgi:hypothetical protein